ncbi:MAG: hypothetical protein WAN35_20935 [Terracidiphilus sp.]
MKTPILGNLSILGKVDERFLEHRRRSTSFAGTAGVLLALVLFEYRLLINHIRSWDLLAVILTMAAVKVALMVWYGFRD